MQFVSYEEYPWGLDGSIIFYGIFADVLMLAPYFTYLVYEDDKSYAQYHQTYINMLFSAYAPLGITWWIVLIEDSKAARTALTGAIEMAGLGPYALLWIGLSSYAMSTSSNGVLNAQNPTVYVWLVVYPIVNFLLMVVHYHLCPPMYAWLSTAPIARNGVDNIKAWSMPPPMKRKMREDEAAEGNMIVFEPTKLDF